MFCGPEAASISLHSTSFDMSKTYLPVVMLVLLGVCILTMVSLFFIGKSVGDEIRMGILVVGSIATLMNVLYLVAAGFSEIQLTDAKQALGLPEGSIRAMIALILIMVFIIFGIYLFRSVSAGKPTFVEFVPVENKIDYEKHKEKNFRVQPINKTVKEKVKDAQGKDTAEEKDAEKLVGHAIYEVTEVGADARGLAQQLVTTIGTLVVAVAGFYFGSSTIRGLRKDTTVVPTIRKIDPTAGKQEGSIPLTIEGDGLLKAKHVWIESGDAKTYCTDIVAENAKIVCKLQLLKEQKIGKYDLFVELDNGNIAELPKSFEIEKLA
jgi:uncharacterized protein YxeA